MALTFYYGSGSPYAWRVWLALEHKRIAYELKTVSFSAGDLAKPEYVALNPRSKVPAITDGDFSLYESAAILEYLEEQYSTGKVLFPGSVRQRATIRRLVREADEYAQGHAPGSVLIPLGQLQQRLHEIVGYKNRPVALICRSGNRSAQALKLLESAGFSAAVNVEGGMMAWQKAGLPVISGAASR